VASIGDVLNNPVITFFLGLIPSLLVALVIEYVKYYRSKIRSREESLLPYLRKLHGNISKILEQTDAKNLRNQYNDWRNTKITQKMVENATQQVMEEEKIEYAHIVDRTLSPASIKEVLFLHGYHSFEELVTECIKFEAVYEEMVTEGLLNVLKVKYSGLYQRMLSFHSCADNAIKDVKQGTVKINKIKNMTDFHENYHDDGLDQLFMCDILVHNIFIFGTELEKELRKFL
jgi:hypothetical protein